MTIPEDPDDTLQIDIVPMIDVIFAILTFFIMSSFLRQARGVPVNLPQAQMAQSQQQSKLTVTVDEHGKVFLDRQPIAVTELAAQVRASIAHEAEALVVINAAEKVEPEQVIARMDQLRSLPGGKLDISTRRPERGRWG